MKILSQQNLILNRQIQRELEREHGSVLIIHEGNEGRCMKDILKGSIIIFQDFHLQGSFQNCPIFTSSF